MRTSLVVTLLLGFVVSACAAGAVPTSPHPSPASPAGEPMLEVTARGLKFDRAELRVRANQAVTLLLENADRDLHNFELRDETGQQVFMGELFSGPDVRQESLPALAAGRYSFLCTAHPNMKGTLLAD